MSFIWIYHCLCLHKLQFRRSSLLHFLFKRLSFCVRVFCSSLLFRCSFTNTVRNQWRDHPACLNALEHKNSVKKDVKIATQDLSHLTLYHLLPGENLKRKEEMKALLYNELMWSIESILRYKWMLNSQNLNIAQFIWNISPRRKSIIQFTLGQCDTFGFSFNEISIFLFFLSR